MSEGRRETVPFLPGWQYLAEGEIDLGITRSDGSQFCCVWKRKLNSSIVAVALLKGLIRIGSVLNKDGNRSRGRNCMLRSIREEVQGPKRIAKF